MTASAGTGLKPFTSIAQRLAAGSLAAPAASASSSSGPKTRFPVADRIYLHKGDITKVATAAIVNAANASLAGGGGVDGQIHRAAGRELLEECATLVGCQTGDAKITKGYKLPAKHVIHTVGPIYNATRHQECERALASCYERSLELAIENGLDTLAFPSISTGVYGYPKEAAARTAVQAVARFLAERDRGTVSHANGNGNENGAQAPAVAAADGGTPQIKGVVFVAYSDGDLRIYEEVLPEFVEAPTTASASSS